MKRGPAQIAHALGGAFTRILNAMLWGDARQSLSARTGYALHRGKRWARVVAPLIDGLLRSRNHCLEQAAEAGLIPLDPAAAPRAVPPPDNPPPGGSII